MTPLGSLLFPEVKESRPALTSLNIHGVFIICKHTFIPLFGTNSVSTAHYFLHEITLN